MNAVACTRLDDGTPIAVTGADDDCSGDSRGVRLGPAHRPAAGHPGRPHPAGARAVACTRLDDGTPLAVTGTDAALIYRGDHGGGEVIVWDLRTGRQRATLAGHTRPGERGIACTRLDDGTPLAVTERRLPRQRAAR